MDVARLVDPRHARNQLTHKAASRLTAERSMSHNVIEELATMERFKYLAIMHFLNSPCACVRHPCLVRRLMQAHNIGVLAKTLQNFQIILVDYDAIRRFVKTLLFSHCLQGNLALTVIHSWHRAAADFLEHLEVARVLGCEGVEADALFGW